MKPCEISERLSAYIAVVGFVCACLVVGLHVNVSCDAGSGGLAWRLTELLRGGGLGGWAVSVFFVISGFLIAGKMQGDGWWRGEVKKRMWSLLLPLLFWNLSYLIFRMTLTSVAGMFGQEFDGGHWNELSVGRIAAAVGLNPIAGMELPPLWYVRCLIGFVLIAPFFSLMRYRWVGGALVVALFVFYHYFPQMLPPAPSWETHFAKICWARGAAWYSLGIWLRWNVRLGESHPRCPGVPSFLVDLGRHYAFPVFLMHPFVLTLFIAGFKVLGIKDLMATSWWSWWMQLVASVAICCATAAVLRRWLPRASAMMYGGR